MSPTLRQLQAYYILPVGSWNDALFDLSGARHASIFIKFEMDYEISDFPHVRLASVLFNYTNFYKFLL
jgi:hypothetical protein